MKDIVIIGGMGPQASLELHRRILDKAADNGAKNGQDFPLIRHLSLPIEDFISSPNLKTKALEAIKDALDGLYNWRSNTNSYRLQYSTFTKGRT